MHIWRSVILHASIFFTCRIPLYLCSMRIVTPARVLAARTGATKFQEYVDNNGNNKPSQRFLKRLDNAADGIENYQGVVGRSGIDFPVLTEIPNTKFNCQQYGNGYFADLDTKCQVFHICDEGKKISFLCPNGTIFRQLDLICDWWFKVDCSAAPNHYAESSEMLTQAQRARNQSKYPIHQPITSAEQFSLNAKRKYALLNGSLRPNLEAMAFNRRMDTSLDESDESIDFEDISLKRNNIRRSNIVSKVETYSSDETQTADEAASLLRNKETMKGYSYPIPDKTFVAPNSMGDYYDYDKSEKNSIKNNRNIMSSMRSAKVLENNFDQNFGTKKSLNFDPKPLIMNPVITMTPVASTTTKWQTLKATTISSIHRGSTTHQTSTLNQKLESIEQTNPYKGSKVLAQPSFNFSVYTTARKPSTKSKDKPFYTPTIPTVINKSTSETLKIIPTVATISGAAKHALEMMKTLQELEISEAVLVNRPGVEVPPSSGPDALHSLALYFADTVGVNATATISPNKKRLSTKSLLIEEKRPPLLSQKTIDRYQQLFDVNTPSTTTESPDFETRFSDDYDNDLEGQYSRHSLFSSSGSPQIRELAQVFTHALSAYLQDPDTFRRILSEIRPKAPHQLAVSNHIDNNKSGKNEDKSTEDTSYILTFNQITPVPRAALRDELEVLNYSGVAIPIAGKHETTIGSTETTTEISYTTTINEIEKSNDYVAKTPASHLITEDLEKNAAAYRERQIKNLSSNKRKNELADEVNEELRTMKSPTFSLEEFEEKIGNSNFSSHKKIDQKSSNNKYGTKTIPLHWRQQMSTTTTDSSHTVYFELLPPLRGKSNSPHKKVFLSADPDEISEDDEQLQRAQSQSIIASRNALESKNNLYSFLKTHKDFQQSGKIASDIRITTMTPTTITGQYIIKYLSSKNFEDSTVPVDIVSPVIFDTGKITPNLTTPSYTVFLDPLTINDGLMDIEKNAALDKTIINTHTYLPSSQMKTTNAYVASTTTAKPKWYSTVPSSITSSRRMKSSNKLRADESNERELMETMQNKANKMFGDLDESEADHLMNVIKTADTNKSVRRLILLLIQTCDDDYNKTVEASRKALLSALINMDHQAEDSSEVHIVKSRFNKKEKGFNLSTITAAAPVTSYRSTQFERLTGTTTFLNLRNKVEPITSETTTTIYDEMKSTNIDLLTETSTTIFTDNRMNDDIETTTIAINLFPEQYATTNIPTTTNNYDTTTNGFTTTEFPTSMIISTTLNTSQSFFEPRIKLIKADNRNNQMQKNIGNAETARNNPNQHSDTRALELLRSLYSLASRWG